jgi:hypothetical protein
MDGMRWEKYKGPAVFLPIRQILRTNAEVIDTNNRLHEQNTDLRKQVQVAQATSKTLAEMHRESMLERSKALKAAVKAAMELKEYMNHE